MTSDVGEAVQGDTEFISEWLKAIDRVAPADYVEVQNLKGLPDGERVEDNSRFWMQHFFHAEANPYNQKSKVKQSIHHATAETYDMLRHDYSIKRMPVEVIETVEFIFIRVNSGPVSLLTLSEPDKKKTINDIAATVLNMSGTYIGPGLKDTSYHWTFQFRAPIAEGSCFSTDPNAIPSTMWSWASRVDGGIHRGHLYFLCHKKREATSGRMIALDGQHWFDGRCWSPPTLSQSL